MHSSTSVPAAAPSGNRWRGPLTVLGTVLVVVIEFFLLTGVYERREPVQRQQQVIAAMAGQWDVADVGSLPAVRARTDAALDRLSQLGVSGRDLAGIRSADMALTVTGDQLVGRERIAAAVDTLSRQIAGDKRWIDLQAKLIYGALLVIASFGWMLWFRRLVRRHRDLERRMTEQQSRAEGEQRLAALVRNATDVVVICDLDGRVRFGTPSLLSVLAVDPEAVIDASLADMVEPDDVETLHRVLSTVRDGEDRPLRLRMRHRDGRLLHVEGTVTNLLADPAVGGMVVTFRDVTQRVELEAQLSHQAFHDPLTGLANRQLFSDRLEHALSSRSSDRALVVLFCDLDEFKNVNDSLGHGVGDRVLEEVGRRAVGAARIGDTVARLGGDEFAVLLEDTDQREGEEIAERLLEAISRPIDLDGTLLNPRVSIGLAGARPGERSGADVLRNADVAMYLAKDRGKGTVAVYEPRLHTEALERLAMRADLQRAIREGELVLHYQPTIDLSDGSVAGFEALVRWNHPERGMVPPLEFIPIAEQTGLIHALGSWVLRTACEAATELCTGKGGRPLTMAVNVASAQLGRDDFVSEVFAVLERTGLRPQQLTLEITESQLLQNVELMSERLTRLRDSGIRIAIDDFGTGYSSLAYLRDLPVDVLKVDKAFVDRVMSNAQDAALTEAILRMSANMSLTTVAEGVEDSDQAGWLADANCVYGQGYFWSRPVSLEGARTLLAGSNFARPGGPRSLPGPRSVTEVASKP